MSLQKKITFNVKPLQIEGNNNFIKKKSSLFRSKTLGVQAKLSILFSKNVNIQKCFQIMKKERSNRGIMDIEYCKNLFRTFDSFYSYISLNNNQEETDHMLSEVAWVMFHKKLKKNTLIKKSGEKNEFFYLLMSGKIQKVSIIFKREKITLKEYIIYLLKMKLIKEYELLKKCRQVNKSIMNIHYENIEFFCEKNPKYNYSDLLKIATDEIINMGFDLKKINHNEEWIEIPSIQNYLDVGAIKKDIKSQINKGPTIYLYIPKYELSCTLNKGDYFGFLNKDMYSEYSSYICLEDCDLGFINKSKINESFIFEQNNTTLSNYFSNNKNKYYIFKDIDNDVFNNKYSTFINYKKFKQGDKIFLQNSLNEGIFLIKDGEIKISSNTKLNDLAKLMLKLIWSLKGFQEHVPPSEFKNIVKENDEDNNSSIKDIASYEDNNTNFDFGILKEGDILGLNELYDYNTTIYNFSAECISKEASLFFINKNNFNLILSKEKSLYSSVIQKVELRIKYMIGCIKNFKKKLTIENYKTKNDISKFSYKPIIRQNLKKNFNNNKYWSKNQNNTINFIFNEKTDQNMPSIKKKHRNKSTAHLNTINNNIPIAKVREKIINKEFMFKSQDKINTNKNIFDNYISSNIFKFFSNQKPNYYHDYLKEKNLSKNRTYNNLIKKQYKGNYQLYNFTTPNKGLKKNSNIFIFNDKNENKKDVLPILCKDLNKGNLNKNTFFKCKTLHC